MLSQSGVEVHCSQFSEVWCCRLDYQLVSEAGWSGPQNTKGAVKSGPALAVPGGGRSVRGAVQQDPPSPKCELFFVGAHCMTLSVHGHQSERTKQSKHTQSQHTQQAHVATNRENTPHTPTHARTPTHPHTTPHYPSSPSSLLPLPSPPHTHPHPTPPHPTAQSTAPARVTHSMSCVGIRLGCPVSCGSCVGKSPCFCPSNPPDWHRSCRLPSGARDVGHAFLLRTWTSSPSLSVYLVDSGTLASVPSSTRGIGLTMIKATASHIFDLPPSQL